MHGCDVVCPSVPLLFGEYFADVGGICVPPSEPLCGFDPAELPLYIPQINHGGRRDEDLDEPWVTVPLYVLARRDRRQRYVVRFQSGEELRRALRVPAHTKIIVTSAVPDNYIEDFWAEHRVLQVPERLAALGLSAMTVPNYSFMLDVPRTNSLYNLSRIFRAAEAISTAGIPTMLHLNASTKKDWERWLKVLRDQPHISSVSLEFQTGTSHRDIGDKYFAGLIDLQQLLGRPLHPFVLAGGGRLAALQKHFRAFTVVDSTPFFKTMKRQILVPFQGGAKWRLRRTAPGASLSSRLATNIERHRNRFLSQLGLPIQTGRGQLLLRTKAAMPVTLA
ncbi:MAG: hypothetical protein V7609_1038 [Verrucomicrobiota bacterium]